MKAPSTVLSESQRARVAARMRVLLAHEKLRLCLRLGKKYIDVPDSEVPSHVTMLFPMLKTYIARTLAPRHPVLKKELATQPHVVILVNRASPSDLPDGLWFAFARPDADGLVSTFQLYLAVRACAASMRFTRETVRMPRGRNASIAPADAQLLIDFAHSTSSVA